MGSSQNIKQYSYKAKDWKEEKTNRNNLPFKQVIHYHTKVQGQLYEIELPININCEQELQMYQWRFNTQNRHIVKVLQVQVQNQGAGCCNIRNKATVVTERINLLLKDISIEMNAKNQIIFMIGCFKGFQQLFQKKPFTYLNSSMIGLTENGEVKVWINQNFGNNQYQSAQKQQQEEKPKISKVIQNIVTIFEKKSERFSNSFWRTLQMATTFTQILQYLKKWAQQNITQYSEQTNLNIDEVKQAKSQFQKMSVSDDENKKKSALTNNSTPNKNQQHNQLVNSTSIQGQK